MNSTFSKMAPYIKLLLDILTGNRNSLSLLPSFPLSFPFLSLSTPPPPTPGLPVCLSVSFLNQLNPSFLLMLGGELLQLSRVSCSGVPYNLGTSVWKQLGGNFKKEWSPWRYRTSLRPTREPAVKGGDEQPWVSHRFGPMTCSSASQQMSRYDTSGSSLLLGHHQCLVCFLQWPQTNFFSCRKWVRD